MTEEDDLRSNLATALERVEDLLASLPGETAKQSRNKIKEVRELLLDQRAPRFALVGRRGAGKSSLVNALFGEPLAAVGHEKAQTGSPKWFGYRGAHGRLDFLDSRGFQEAHQPAEEDHAETAVDSILEQLELRCPDTILFLVKATEAGSAMKEDLDQLAQLWKRLRTIHGTKVPVVAVVTQCDLLEPKGVRLHEPDEEDDRDYAEKRTRVKRIERQVAEQIRGVDDAIKDAFVTAIGISAYQSWREDGTRRADERWNIGALVEFLYDELPREARLELARLAQVETLQRRLARSLSSTVASVCALVAATPIPVGDIAPITSLQLMLVSCIGYISGRSLTTKTAVEFLAAAGVNVGGGLALREAARALLKLVPVAGNFASAAIAFAGTMAVGEAAISYFIEHKPMELVKERMQKARDEALEDGSKTTRN